MAIYMIGDLQGCDTALQRLLETVDFSPSRDTLVLLGDLVNRGPESLAVLRRLAARGDAVRCLLGNHDLHLLAVDAGVRRPGRRDTLAELLAAPDRPALLEWLRGRSMALRLRHGTQDILAVHAGVLPAWDAGQVVALAGEVEAVLRGPDLPAFLHTMYGNEPRAWNDSLRGAERRRVVVNALTRLRFCTPEGTMEFESNGGPGSAPPGYLPWFDVPGRRTADVTLAFGHWSALGWLERPHLLSLDTGCVWGGCLTAVRLGATAADNERFQVHCEPSQPLDGAG
ncbi:MAG: symmetrical bis(5'-nucleosyl)-tetraphosphatase [Pseudomonadota bacterium]